MHGISGGSIGATGYGLINHGIIEGDASTPININGNFTNASDGRITVNSASGSVAVNGTNWLNSGTFQISDGFLDLGGSFATASIGTINRTGGTVSLAGSMNNTGVIYDLGAAGSTGSLLLSSGSTITGGTITSTGAAALTTRTGSSPSLNGVSLDADLTVFNSSILSISNGLTLMNGHKVTVGSAVGPASIRFQGTGNQQLTGNGEVLFGPVATSTLLSNSAAVTLEIGSGIRIHGEAQIGLAGAGLINHGIIEADTAGKAMTVLGNFTNASDGKVLASAGTVSVSGNFTSNDGVIDIATGALFKTNNASLINNSTGIIRGAGTLDLGYSASGGPLVYTLKTLTNNGMIDPGYGAGGVGTLTIKGDLIQGATGKVHVDLGGTGAGQYDQLAVTGITSPVTKTAIAQLAGTLEVAEVGGFHADPGNSFPNLVTANGSTSGSFSTLSVPTDVSFTANLSGAVGIADTTASTTRWATDSAGSWASAANWNRGVPTASKDVVISRSLADPLVTISTAGAIAHSLTVDDALKIDGQTLSVGSGTINGNVTLANSGSITTDGNIFPSGGKTLYWSGGTIDGTGGLNFLNGANVGFSGSGNRVMDSAGLTFSFTDFNLPSGSLTLNQGALTFNTTGANVTTLPGGTTLNLQGGTLTNNGPLSIAGAFNISGGTYAGNGSLLMAGGTLNRSGGSWTSTGAMTNTGSINLGTGTYSSPIINQGTIVAGGATFTSLFTNDVNSTLSLTGVNTFSGGLALNPGSTVSGSGGATVNLASSALTFGGTGTYSINGTSFSNVGGLSLLTGQTFNLNSALGLTGALNIATGATLNKQDASAFSTGQPFNNSGTVNLNAGSITLSGGGTEAGAFNTAAGTTLAFTGGTYTLTAPMTVGGAGATQFGAVTFAGAGALSNTGILDITGNTTFNSLFTNSGTLTVSNGVTLNAIGGYTQTAGSTLLGPTTGTAANLSAAGGVSILGGSFGGAGTVTANVTIGAATLAPGHSPGALNITGNLTLGAASVTNIEVGGTTAGSGFDVINVTGSTTLNGTLNVTSYLGYTPAAGANYSFMNFGSSTGAFTTTNLPGGWGINLNSYATYLDLLMPGALAAVAAPLTPLQALQQSIFIQPDALAANDTASGFNRVVENDAETSLGQIVALAWQVSQNDADLMSLKQCQ